MACEHLEIVIIRAVDDQNTLCRRKDEGRVVEGLDKRFCLPIRMCETVFDTRSDGWPIVRPHEGQHQDICSAHHCAASRGLMGGVAVCAKNDFSVAGAKESKAGQVLQAVVDSDPSLPWARERRRSRRSEWPTRGRCENSGLCWHFCSKPGRERQRTPSRHGIRSITQGGCRVLAFNRWGFA